jgi:hypothetical protein
VRSRASEDRANNAASRVDVYEQGTVARLGSCSGSIDLRDRAICSANETVKADIGVGEITDDLIRSSHASYIGYEVGIRTGAGHVESGKSSIAGLQEAGEGQIGILESTRGIAPIIDGAGDDEGTARLLD